MLLVVGALVLESSLLRVLLSLGGVSSNLLLLVLTSVTKCNKKIKVIKYNSNKIVLV